MLFLTKRSLAALLCALTLLMTSCAPAQSTTSEQPSKPESSEPEQPETSPDDQSAQTDLIEQIQALWAQLDTTKLPQESLGRGTLKEFEPGVRPEDLPVQTLYPEDATAYQLANQIWNVTAFSGNILEDFDSPDNAYLPAMLHTALYRTNPLDLTGYQPEDPERKSDHVITALMQEQNDDGRWPSYAFAGEDVHATVTRLFGSDIQPYDMDVGPYYYFKRGDVYLQMGDYGGPMWPYAQITHYEQTDNGYLCEAVLIHALDAEQPLYLTRDGQDINLTAENFEELTADLAKYRYTFTWEDDHLILSALQTLREAA